MTNNFTIHSSATDDLALIPKLAIEAVRLRASLLNSSANDSTEARQARAHASYRLATIQDYADTIRTVAASILKLPATNQVCLPSA